MLASWLKERDQKRELAAEERGLEKGLEEGREAKDREWRAWYERYQAAQREGRPFDEPPPERPVHHNGA
jgi:hypothetical protein